MLDDWVGDGRLGVTNAQPLPEHSDAIGLLWKGCDVFLPCHNQDFAKKVFFQQAQVVEAAIEWERRRGSGIDRTTAHRTAVARLEADWPARKLELVAGKSALARLNDRIQFLSESN